MSNPSRDMSFLDHLEELRWHIIRSTISVLLVAIVAFLAKDIIFDQIIFGPKKGTLLVIRYSAQFHNLLVVMPSCFDELPFRVQSRTVSDNFLLIFGHPYLLDLFLHFLM